MSKGENTPAAPSGQARTTKKPEPTPQDRYYLAWATVGEIIAAILTCAAMKILGQRLNQLAEGGWLPGKGDVNTVAALTNRPVRSIERIVGNGSRLKQHVGRQTFYDLDSFALPQDADSSE